MALNLTGYVDPGTYQAEVVVPSGSSATSLPLTPCLIGVGNRSKRITNEAVLRGLITGETLSLTGSPSADTLADRAVRRQSSATIFMNDVPLANTEWSFDAAKLTTDSVGPFNVNVKNQLTFALDGKTPIVMQFASGGAGAFGVAVAAVSGSSNHFVATITNTPSPVLTGLTGAEVIAAINSTLTFATDAFLGAGAGYGPSYGSVATTDVAGHVVVTSPNNTPSSDVVFYNGFVAAQDALTGALSVTGSAFTVAAENGAKHAKTQVHVNSFNALATYKIDYVAFDTTSDPLVQSVFNSLLRVGNYANTTSFAQSTDYAADKTDDALNKIAWTGTGTNWVAATIDGANGPYDLHTLDTLSISLDGKETVTVDLTGAGSPPGGAAPSLNTAVTAAEAALLINATLSSHKVYGPLYGAVATVTGGNRLKLTSPTAGKNGVVEVSPAPSADASSVLFGLTTSQLPYDVRGSGARPSVGSTYYVTYNYDRASSEYNVVKTFFAPDALFADIGNPAPANKLAVAANIAFKNGAPAVSVVQVDDATVAGSPTQLQMQAAIDGAGDSAVPTEVCVLDTRNAITAYTIQHLVDQCGPMIQHPRRMWTGLTTDTVGDSDSAGSYVYTATTVLQVPGDSPARGRMHLVAPGSAAITTTITLENGAEQVVKLDGTFVAVAVAARFAARTNPAQAMVGSTIVGFNTDSFPSYRPAERRQLASNGVLVVTGESGKLVLLDPLSTEAGAGKLPQFEEPQSSSQKDNITLSVNKAINSNIRGVTPEDLADFILAIKLTIGGVIKANIDAGAIAPYRDTAGRVRSINYSTDIQVFQLKSDPRKYTFRYYYELRYPGKRFFGEYSVDNPFFAGGQTSLTA